MRYLDLNFSCRFTEPSILPEFKGSALRGAFGRGLVQRAMEVNHTESTCRWQEVKRYSSRQQTAMSLGGMVGQVEYRGEDLAPFAPLFRYCETAHIGKQTAFGLGSIKLATGREHGTFPAWQCCGTYRKGPIGICKKNRPGRAVA